MTSKHPANISVLISEDAIQERVRKLGEEISNLYTGRTLCVIGVLKGSFVFMADLIRAIQLPVVCEFIGISSYGDATESSGVVQITSDLSSSIEGKDVLIVEDIIETGITLQYLLANLATRQPKSIRICALLSKPGKARAQVPVDFVGFEIPGAFVVGYGLDYAGLHRDLPYIGVLQQ